MAKKTEVASFHTTSERKIAGVGMAHVEGITFSQLMDRLLHNYLQDKLDMLSILNEWKDSQEKAEKSGKTE